MRVLLLAFALSTFACVADGTNDVDETDYEAESIRGGYVGPFNRAEQGHADVCVRIKGDAIALRYADGSPTGFVVTKAMLTYSKTAKSGVCKDGYLRLDARETLKTKDGRRLYFHRGGYGYEHGSDVKYGHVWIGDLADHVDVEPGNGNGAPCAANGIDYVTRVKPLPIDMHFCKTKGACDSPEDTNGYSSYGDPAQQGSAAGSPIHYTYLNWSWLNVAGGGVVRALVPEGQVVHRCDVPSIKLDTVTEDGKKNGWVRAIYVKTAIGDQWVQGWMVHSHQHDGDPAITYHVAKP